MSQQSHPFYQLLTRTHLKRPGGRRSELCCPLPLHPLPLSNNIKPPLWQLQRSSSAARTSSTTLRSWKLWQLLPNAKRDVGPSVVRSRHLFSPTGFLLPRLPVEKKERDQTGCRRWWRWVWEVLRGPAINNNVELSTQRSEMKGVRRIKKVLHICQRNQASNTFCGIFLEWKQERDVLTRN